MSSWWYYNFAIYGDLNTLKELENGLPDLTYETQSGQIVKAFHDVEVEGHYGFLAVHTARNHGGESPLYVLAENYPTIIFGGAFAQEQSLDTHYTFEIRGGLVDVVEHVDENFDWKGRAITADEVKARITKLTAKIEKLAEERTWNCECLVRYHRDEIGDAVTEKEMEEISRRIDEKQ